MDLKKEPGLRLRLKEALKPLDSLDKEYTQHFAVCASKSSVCVKWRSVMKGLEISCHGVVWLLICLVCLWFSHELETKQVYVNITAALVLDLTFVALIKAFVRRARPSGNDDMFLTGWVDNYSFPSGHASRAVMLATLAYLKSAGFFVTSLTVLWSVAVAGSRVLLGRHHIGDVMAGVLLGLLEGEVMTFLWFEPETAQSILQFFTMFEMFHSSDAV